jgi:hypothetical protein
MRWKKSARGLPARKSANRRRVARRALGGEFAFGGGGIEFL